MVIYTCPAPDCGADLAEVEVTRYGFDPAMPGAGCEAEANVGARPTGACPHCREWLDTPAARRHFAGLEQAAVFAAEAASRR